MGIAFASLDLEAIEEPLAPPGFGSTHAPERSMQRSPHLSRSKKGKNK